jgi:hypothetical protein
MRRVARLLFTLCAAVSLLLCVGVCVLWVRSYWIEDSIRYVARGRDYVVVSSWGRAACAQLYEQAPDERLLADPFLWSTGTPEDMPAADWGIATVDWRGFSLVRDPSTSGGSLTFVSVPIWSVAVLTVIAPVLRWRSARRAALRHRKDVRDLCSSCGYDLRASPERCPECGKATRR